LKLPPWFCNRRRVDAGRNDVPARVPDRDRPVMSQVAEAVLMFAVGSVLIFLLVVGLGRLLAAW
jgi:hypothetical protein